MVRTMPLSGSRKRKLPDRRSEREVDEVDTGKFSDGEEEEDEFKLGGILDAEFSDDDEDDEEDEDFNDKDSDFDSDNSDEEEGASSDLESVDIPTPHNGTSKESSDLLVDSDAEDLPPGTRITTDSSGAPRYLYPPIDPVYDSDDSTTNDANNTIGNIPMELYDAFPHIGYDLEGRRVMRPATGKALDALLDSVELPKGWTGLVDKNTGLPLRLSDEEMEIVAKIQGGRVGERDDGEGYDPYEPMVEWFSSKLEMMPLSAAPEPKRRFVPSKHEAKRVSANHLPNIPISRG